MSFPVLSLSHFQDVNDYHRFAEIIRHPPVDSKQLKTHIPIQLIHLSGYGIVQHIATDCSGRFDGSGE
jgi:hypothetical protein